MFNAKKDRMVVEITIEFNITAIGKWLKGGGRFEDIDKLKRDWDGALIQKYVIDMLPIGQTSNAYFHRNKGIISQNITGFDYLESANEDIRIHLKIEPSNIANLGWDMWRGRLLLKTRDKLLLMTPPLTEVVELETTGELSSFSGALEDTKITVPVSFEKDHPDHPKEFMEIWQGAGPKSLGYGNALGHVSFSTDFFKVEY